MDVKTMQATDLRKDLYRTLDEVERLREPVKVMRLGRPVATIVPSPSLPASRRKPVVDLDAVEAFCKTHNVKSFALFGSILTDCFDEQSDVDVLLDTGNVGLRELGQMKEELAMMFGRITDVILRSGLPYTTPARRESIESKARVI